VLVVDALRRLQQILPFQLRGLDTDNGGKFINETMHAFCQDERLELTRSRPYRKNDQAWVEQKNGAIVRRLVGYGRVGGASAPPGVETTAPQPALVADTGIQRLASSHSPSA